MSGVLQASPEEYQTRRERVSEAMRQQGLDVLIVSDPANMHYLSGYDGWSFYVPQALVVDTSSGPPHWIGRPQDAGGARLTTTLEEEHIHSYPEAYVQSEDHHPMDAVADLVASLGGSDARIGVEMDAYYFTGLAWQRLEAGLPRARFQDATLLVNWCRLVKSPWELELMRQAAVVAGQAMATAVDAIVPGVRESDAAARIVAAEYGGTAEICGDYPAIVPLMPSQERTTASHLTWVDRRYEAGDVVNLELAGCVRRYHAPLARTLCLGTPPARLADLGKVVEEGVEAALATIAPGATGAAVEAAWRQTINRHGYEKESRLGYAVGIGYPPDWGEHTASFRPGDETVLAPGMTFHLMAGMWMADQGLEISETVCVTDQGCDVLTSFPRQLLVTR